MTVKSHAADAARALLTASYDGALASHSHDVPGYPFGSVMPFVLDRHGCPVILIASIAQHTRNIRHDPRVSLMVFERRADDLQQAGRLTLLADAEPVAADDADTIARYERFFPESGGYHLTHDFSYWRLRPKRARFIGGFGAIHWLQPAQLMRANPFDEAAEAGMAEHMNADHADAMLRYCRQAGLAATAGTPVHLAGVDGEGFHIRLGERLVRIAFSRPVSTGGEVRAEMVRLARGEPA